MHYLGRLSAPVDEAELAHVDPTVDRRARRARRLRYAVAALLVLPSVAATTLYGLEHQDKVDELIEFTRVALVAPLVRAAKDVLDSNRDADEPAPQPPPAPQPAAPAVIPAPQETTRSPALAVPPAGEGAASEPAHAADAAAGADASGADASAANTAH
ncbi:MAG TPA: hypothetical protein VFC24_12295 [Casimicrobiaceae bacterium]|nr:hypothetical protein [Casimicrobiaceae bacterium]